MKLIKKLGLSAALVVCSTSAFSAVVTFDDFSTTSGHVALTDGYAGLNWDNFGVIHQDSLPGSGYELGTVSGDYTAFNWADRTTLTTSSSAFDFNGAYFTSAWDPLSTLHLLGSAGGSVVYDIDVDISNTGPLWIQADFIGIDSLTLYTSPGTQFVMDNFTVNETSVSEPASLALLGLGLMGLGFARRRAV